MGVPKKYSKKALREAVQAYFDSITREIDITERVPTGKLDSWGHPVYEIVKVENKLGQVAKRTEYLVPPTLGGLCIHLGIVNSTWSRWSDPDKYPEYEIYRDIVADVRQRLLTWRQEQVVTRKDVKGLVWDMEVNFGCNQKADTTPKLQITLGEDTDAYGE